MTNWSEDNTFKSAVVVFKESARKRYRQSDNLHEVLGFVRKHLIAPPKKDDTAQTEPVGVWCRLFF